MIILPIPVLRQQQRICRPSVDISNVEARRRERKQEDLDLSDLTELSPAQMYQSSGQAEAVLEELKNKMALIDVDLKGLKVDETV